MDYNLHYKPTHSLTNGFIMFSSNQVSIIERVGVRWLKLPIHRHLFVFLRRRLTLTQYVRTDRLQRYLSCTDVHRKYKDTCDWNKPAKFWFTVLLPCCFSSWLYTHLNGGCRTLAEEQKQGRFLISDLLMTVPSPRRTIARGLPLLFHRNVRIFKCK